METVTRILLAPDSFKGSLSALEVCAALEAGARQALPDAQFVAVPLADGGEGTLDALLRGAGGQKRFQTVRGPDGTMVEAAWGFLPDGRAVIEMAQASGLTLTAPAKRDAARASSFGTGTLIKAALDAGCREFLIGIGGSATSDGGTGALAALGAFFRDEKQVVLPPGGGELGRLSEIDLRHLDPRLQKAKITVLCDVSNPLCGENGAARVYGPQKGATTAQVEFLDAGLGNFARIAAKTVGRDRQNEPGVGAAGGLGFALLAFCNADLKPGIEVVLEAANFVEKVRDCDLVLTGEGSLDAQTLSGKAVAGVARAAKTAGVPVLAFGGAVRLSGAQLDELGVLSAFALADGPRNLEEGVQNAAFLLENAAERALRLWNKEPQA